MFMEAEFKLTEMNKIRKNKKMMSCESSPEEVSELIKPGNRKNGNKMNIIHKWAKENANIISEN